MTTKANLLFLVVLAAAPVGAWDPLGVKAAAQEVIDGLTDEVLPELKEIVQDEMDDLFDNKLSKFVDQVSKAAVDLEDHAKEEAEELINDAVHNITVLANSTIALAEQMANQTINEIKDAMDDFVDTHVTALVDHVYDEIGSLLTRIETDIQTGLCEEEGILKQLELFVGTTIQSLDCDCARDVALEYGKQCKCSCSRFLPAKMTCHCSPASWVIPEDQIAYKYMECHERKAIESGTIPVDKIVEELSGLQSFAEQLRCYHVVADGARGSATMFYTDKILNLSKEKYLWAHPTSAALDAPHPGLRGTSVFAPMDTEDCTDKTPYECYLLAMQAAEAAEQTYNETTQSIKDKASEEELQADVKRLEAEVASLTKEVQTNLTAELAAEKTEFTEEVMAVKTNLTALNNRTTHHFEADDKVIDSVKSILHDPFMSFGGIFGGTFQTCSPNSAEMFCTSLCPGPNPITKQCDCPAGFNATQVSSEEEIPYYTGRFDESSTTHGCHGKEGQSCTFTSSVCLKHAP